MTGDHGEAAGAAGPRADPPEPPGPDQTEANASDERLLRGQAGRLLLTASLGWTAIQAGRLVLSPMLPAVMADLNIGEFRAGIGFTVMWGLYALGQYPSGRLSDRLSRTSLLVPGLVLLSVGFGALVAAPTYPLYLAALALVGAGAGLYPTAARALISDLFVARRGQAFGLHTSMGDLGGVIAAGLAVVALAVATWRGAFLPIVVVLLVVTVALHRWRRRPYEFRRVDMGVRSTATRLFGNRRLAALLGAYILFAFTWQGAVGFLPTFLQQAKGFSPGLAGGGFAALFVVGVTVKPLAGGLGDRVSKPLVAAGGLAFGAASLVVAVVVGGTLPVALAVVAFAAGLMAVPPVLQAYLMDLFPDGTMGGDLGAARTIYTGLGALGPTYVGFVAGRAGYGPAFAGLAVALLASAVLLLVASR